MKVLMPRTTYKRRDGGIEHVAGPTGELFDGKRIFWTIAGWHYTEDGLRLNLRRIQASASGQPQFERYAETGNSTLILESADTADPWWRGVNTELAR